MKQRINIFSTGGKLLAKRINPLFEELVFISGAIEVRFGVIKKSLQFRYLIRHCLKLLFSTFHTITPMLDLIRKRTRLNLEFAIVF